GYADDRIADEPGWTSFDVGAVRCPVVVLHGAADVICDPIHARHTASLVDGAELVLVPELGHLSITDQVVPTLARLRRAATCAPAGSGAPPTMRPVADPETEGAAGNVDHHTPPP